MEDEIMKKKALKFDDAVAAFHELFEDKRALPQQPNRDVSGLRGTTWYLRNVNGPLARVNHKGEVRTGKIAD